MIQATATQALMDVLNRQIANWNILYVKLHHYHWYVKGKHFYELHIKFEEFYEEAATYIDELAERLLAMNGKPASTMRDYLQHASITEAAGNETADQMVQNITNDFTLMVNELKSGIESAEKENDDSTVDMLIGIRTSLEKHLWMLNAFMAK